MRVAILGSRGFPSTYGGFETMVRRLAPYLHECGAKVMVYGREPDRRTSTIDDVIVVNTRGVDRKATSTLSYGASSMWHARGAQPDAALVLNVANGFWLPGLRQAGVPTAVNVDGIEWERGKWNGVGKKVFWWGAKLTARFADTIICDSVAIASTWRDLFGVGGVFIPYGADIVDDLSSERVEALGLTRRRYCLLVARLVPENNIEVFLDATRAMGPDTQVVVVGSAVGNSPIEARLQDLHDSDQLLWLGHVHDQDLLAELWANAGAYFHGHSAGGTNPALLQAMGFGAPVIAFDTVYNREVLGTDGTFVRTSEELVTALKAFLQDDDLRRTQVIANRETIAARYTWEGVCRDYAEELRQLASRRHSG